MPLRAHLEELRRVLLVSGAAWCLASLAALAFHAELLAIALHPLMLALPDARPVFLNPLQGMTIPLELAGLAGLLVSVPVMSWQGWRFVKPALRRQERRMGLPFITSGILLFYCGALFAYLVLPIGLSFLARFMGSSITYLPDVGQYLSFFLLVIAIFGITFEFPLLLVTLAGMHVFSSSMLRRRRKAIIIGIIFFALIITPGADPFTPTALAIPMILLFEASIAVIDHAMNR